ncbi:MAG: hypothetical protein J2P13_12080 [Acidobacteria bacterium]|nr:hypothetical protein [Acidobacteriota bacterium]
MKAALRLHLPDGFGPNEIPPASVRLTGNAGSAPVKLILPAILISGFPLKVTLGSAQLLGVTVNWTAKEPARDLSTVPWTSPVTEIEPPPEQASLRDKGKSQLSPFAVGVQLEDCWG